METDSDFWMRSYYCFVEWLTTCSNWVCPKALQWWQRCGFFGWDCLLLTFLVLGFLVSFFSSLEGASKIDLPLSMFSLVIPVLYSLLAGETNTAVLEKAILEEEKSYPKLVLSKIDFWNLSISSSFALEVLSSWALTYNSSASSFFVFSARKLFSNRKAPLVWFASSIFVESSS